MIKLSFTGYIGKDATVQDQDGQIAIRFSVGVTKTWNNRQGQRTSKTVWVGCTYWRDLGKDNVSQYLRKGTQVYVDGEPSPRAWLNEGKAEACLDCRVTMVELLNKPQEVGA